MSHSLLKSTLTSLLALPIMVTAQPPAAPINVTIHPNHTLTKTSDNLLLGSNIGLWYKKEQMDMLRTNPLIKQWAPGILRIPGGSWSDEFFWNGNGVLKNGIVDPSKKTPNGWDIDFSDWKPGFHIKTDGTPDTYHGETNTLELHQFTHQFAKQTIVTVNAGTGTPKLAAEWVRWANKKMGFNVKYWEIGNELEGSWEAGNTRPDGSKMDAKKYAKIFIAFSKAMKAVDPTIKVGGPTSANDSITYAEELIKSAGNHLDFISYHTYPADSRLTDSRDLLNETTRISTSTHKIKNWIKQYQPNRSKGPNKIQIAITEWHVQVNENENTCNLLSGVWSARFVGEMLKNDIDFANQWDLFTTKEHGGHGLFPDKAPYMPPRAAFWAFWLWSQHMGDQLVASQSNDPDLVSYATLDGSTIATLLINQSTTRHLTVNLATGKQKFTTAKAVELSHKNYLWNPYTVSPIWSRPPVERTITFKNNNHTITLPPLSATVVRLGEVATKAPKPSTNPTPSIILPPYQPSDLTLHTLLTIGDGANNKPYIGKPVHIKVNIDGPLTISPATLTKGITLDHPAIPISLKPTGHGIAKIHITCNGKTTTIPINLKKIANHNTVFWSFGKNKDGNAELKEIKSILPIKRNINARRNQDVLEISFNNFLSKKGNDHILEINPLPKRIPKNKIGGVIVKLIASEELRNTDKNNAVQVIMQAEGLPWIHIATIPINQIGTDWDNPKEYILPITDPNHLKAMTHAYSLFLIVDAKKVPLNGSLYVDDLGFILRN